MSSKAIQDALSRGQMPMLIKLINTIASRFGIVVSEKLAAQSIPLIGAAGGAAINLMFIDHFQDMAEGHFIVKRLEKKYGSEKIEVLYNGLVL
jgi:glycerate kinase